MPSTQPLCPTQDFTIYRAQEVKQLLLDALFANNELELDLSHVGEMDAAGLQLLILLKKEAQRSGKQVRIVAHSPAVRDVIDFCNIAAEFGDPLVIPANETAS